MAQAVAAEMAGQVFALDLTQELADLIKLNVTIDQQLVPAVAGHI